MKDAHLAETAHPVHELVRKRWSPRALSDRPVDAAVMRSLLEAARWAPSCFNEQPWSYIVAKRENPAEFEQLLSCIVPKNQEWAKNAPVLMLSVASNNFARNQKPNRHSYHDVGAASAWLTVQATEMGLYVHQMGGFDPEKARELYGIPADADAVAAIAVGYLGDANKLPEDFHKGEEVRSPRKPQKDFVFAGKWGKIAHWVKV